MVQEDCSGADTIYSQTPGRPDVGFNQNNFVFETFS